MANANLTRPVVTMNLANRSIGRFGLLANRVMHPLAARHFGRQVAPLAVISDLKIVPTETGIVAETSFGNIDVNQPLYSRLLGKAGVSQIAIPKGTDEEKIQTIFKKASMAICIYSIAGEYKHDPECENINGQESLTEKYGTFENFLKALKIAFLPHKKVVWEKVPRSAYSHEHSAGCEEYYEWVSNITTVHPGSRIKSILSLPLFLVFSAYKMTRDFFPKYHE